MAPGKALRLVGISLASEDFHKNAAHDIPLGITSVPLDGAMIVDLRDAVMAQLSSLPLSFTFITKHGWPVTKTQEPQIDVNQLVSDDDIVRIQKCYNRPRVGLCTTDGKAVGFVFAERDSSISCLRCEISEQVPTLADAVAAGEFGEFGEAFRFIDRNGWPVDQRQEGELSVVDLLHDGCVRVGPVAATHGRQRALCTTEESSLAKRRRISRRPNHFEPQLPITSTDDPDGGATVCTTQRDIVISYVRTEAEEYATALKTRLTQLGLVVFLDQDDVETGSDWQDEINMALQRCLVFIPLVTPKYGRTLWTNREIKMADVLKKLILPVSFVRDWPPLCLAIQFASIQFTRGSCRDDHCSKVSDINGVHEVGSELNNLIRNYMSTNAAFPGSLQTQASTPLWSCPIKLPADRMEPRKHKDGKPLVVVSLHPKQNSLGVMLSQHLTQAGYSVWCSTELMSGDELRDQTQDTECDGQASVSQSSILSPIAEWNKDKITKFQEFANKARIVLFVLSKAFSSSSTSQGQLFYCEGRKQCLPLCNENFCMPGWMSTLVGTGILLDIRSGVSTLIPQRVREMLHGVDLDGATEDTAKLNQTVFRLEEKLYEPLQHYCVYISGSSRLHNKRSAQICRALGGQLAQLEGVAVVTGGMSGAGATVAEGYAQRRKADNKRQYLWHVVPDSHPQDARPQTGETVCSGVDSRTHEAAIAKIFHICVLIEGGPGAAHEASQFFWNDRLVIPICCTGGAAGGKFNVQESIFKAPSSDCSKDWQTVIGLDKSVAADTIGRAVVRVIDCVRKQSVASKNELKSNADSGRGSTLEGETVNGVTASNGRTGTEVGSDSVSPSLISGQVNRGEALSPKPAHGGQPTLARQDTLILE